MDFSEIAKRLEPHGSVVANKFMLRAEITDRGEPYELTLFTDGRAIVKGTKEATVARERLRQVRWGVAKAGNRRFRR